MKSLDKHEPGGGRLLVVKTLEELNTMAKKVFIGVLAALMLFAFVACDGGTAASGTITMVEATTSKEYVKDLDTPVASDFTFTGYTITGEPVNIPSNQFDIDEVGTPADNEAEVTFVWATTNIPVKPATVTVYDDAEFDLAVGTAEVNYYIPATGTFAAVPEKKDEIDFTAIKPEGLVITVSYDNNTKTREITVDENTEGLVVMFGTVDDTTGAFTPTNNTNDETRGDMPSTTGTSNIGVYINGLYAGSYKVTLLKDVVKSVAL